MAVDYKESLRELMESNAKLAEGCPGVMRGFGRLHGEAVNDGAVSREGKGLSAVGGGRGLSCAGCIQAGVKGALDAGATREEIYETIGVAILMSGGPGTTYGSVAMEVMEQFLAE